MGGRGVVVRRMWGIGWERARDKGERVKGGKVHWVREKEWEGRRRKG